MTDKEISALAATYDAAREALWRAMLGNERPARLRSMRRQRVTAREALDAERATRSR